MLLALFAVAACGPLGCGSDEGPPANPESGPPGANGDPKKAADLAWNVARHPALGTPTFLQPRGKTKRFLSPGQPPEEAARAVFGELRAALEIRDPAQDLVIEESVEKNGLTTAAFTQVSRGLPVLATRTSVVFDREGTVAFVSGHHVPNVDGVSRTPTLTAAQALEKAVAALDEAKEGRQAAPDRGAPPVLAIYATTATDARLVYELYVALVDAPITERVIVDAMNGAILDREALEQDLARSAPGVYAYLPEVGNSRRVTPDMQTFPSVSVDGKIYMGRSNTSSVPGLRAWDASTTTTGSSLCGNARGNITGGPRISMTTGERWDDAERLVRRIDCTRPNGAVVSKDVDGRGVAPTVLPIFEKVEAHFRTSLGLGITALAGGTINVYFHARSSDFNASWYPPAPGGTGFFTIGDMPVGAEPALGGIDTRGLAVSFGAGTDVVAHEYQHAVTELALRLVYENQSGALNESLSDVFGAIVERAIDGESDSNWTIGERWLGNGQTALRSMNDPYSVADALRQPFHMAMFLNLPVSQDHGGVHGNSGIPNYAFHLMVAGGTSCPPGRDALCAEKGITSVPVQALGWDDATTVWLGVLQAKSVAPRATFADFARASVAVAESRLPNARANPNGPIRSVACAWVATGVLTADEAKSSWNVKCDNVPSCVTSETSCADQFPGQNAVCSWNGETSCCKRGAPATIPCYTDDDCAADSVCGLSSDDPEQGAFFSCMKRGTDECLR